MSYLAVYGEYVEGFGDILATWGLSRDITEGLYRHDIRISGVVCRGLGSRAGLLEGTRDLVSRCKRDYKPRRS